MDPEDPEELPKPEEYPGEGIRIRNGDIEYLELFDNSDDESFGKLPSLKLFTL